jgi:hypothetical protein
MVIGFQEWLRAQTTPDAIAMFPPGEAKTGEGISLVLHRVERSEGPRSDGGGWTVDAVLLILVGGTDAQAAATLCGEVMFALHDERWMDEDGVTRSLRLETGAAADEARRGLGLPPGHAILVRLPLHRERKRELVQPVREPMRLSTEDMSVLEGVVVGEIEGSQPQPLADARIEAPDYGRFATSDHRGRFRISGLPGKGAITLAVSAKGHSQTMSVEARTGVVVVRVPIGKTVENR